MKAFRAAVVFAVVIAAACGQGDSDINLEGTITSAATLAPIADAEIALQYQAVAVFDPGVVLRRSDSLGRYSLFGREAPCEGLRLQVTAPGFQPSARVSPKCDKALQQINFALQP